MRPGVHRFLLPPALLGLHGLLLLPILIPYRPDSSSYPDSSLNFALHSAPYAVPLACLAFASVALLRLLASSQCLPTAVLLFLLGVLEEAVRWSLVRCLSDADGGGGGYGATHPEPDNHGPLSRGGYRLPASNSIEVAPGIWEGVYIMGWTWSALESMHIWWLLRPATAASSSAAAAVDDLPISSRPHSYHSWRKEHAKKRSTDSTIRTIRGFPKNQMEQSSPNDRRYPFLEENTFVQPGFLGTFDERARASSPEVSRRCVREEDNDAGDEETSATDNDNDGMDSPLTPINYRAAVPTHSTRPLPEDEDDEQEESTPTQQKHNARFFTSSSLASESDYLGQREPTWAFSNPISPNRQALDKSRRLNPATSDSEAESTQSGTQTPLLSSSIPLEQEQTSLLDHSRAHSYGSTQLPSSQGYIPPLDIHSSQSQVLSRPTITSHPSSLSITTGDEAEDESDTQGKGSFFGRAYPPYPTFSSSYIHRHFPSPVLSNTTYGQITPTNTPPRYIRPRLATSHTLPVRKGRSKRPRSYPSITQQPFTPIDPIVNPDSQRRRRMNGVDVNDVSFILTSFWAATAAFQHTGFGLWYVWFPTPTFERTIQWWSIVFFLGVAFSKGVSVAQAGSGWTTANGFTWPSTVGCAAFSFLLYFIALILWGVLW